MALYNSAEGQPSGTTFSAANSGGLSGDAFNQGGGGVLTFDNTHAAHGANSYHLTSSTSATVTMSWNTLGSAALAYFRCYMYWPANPAGFIRFFTGLTSGGAALCAAAGVTSAGKVQVINTTGATISTSTASIPLNAWFRVEGWFLASATVGQSSVSLFTSMDSPVAAETNLSAATQNTNAGPIAFHAFGEWAGAANVNYWMDDIAASLTAPLGPAVVQTVWQPPAASRMPPGLVRQLFGSSVPFPVRQVGDSVAVTTTPVTDTDSFSQSADAGEQVVVQDASVPDESMTGTDSDIGSGTTIQVSGYDVGTAARPGPAWRARFQPETPRPQIVLPSDKTFVSDTDAGSAAEPATTLPAVTDTDFSALAAELEVSIATAGADAATGTEGVIGAGASISVSGQDALTASAQPSPAWRARFRRFRPAIPLPGNPAVYDTDTGSGADTVASTGLADTDAASAAEGTPSAALSDSDTGSAADAGAVTPTVSDSDTGSATAEAASIQATLASTDTATGTEGVIGAGAAIQVSGYDVGTQALPGQAWLARFRHTRPAGTITLPGNPVVASADTGSGSEQAAAPALSDTDTASAAEGSPSAGLAGSETGLAADSALVKVSDSDSGSATAESASVAATLSDSDAASAAEGTSSAGLSQADTAAAAEGTPQILPSDTDASSGAEGSPSAALSSTDTASAAEGVIGAGAAISVSGYDVGTAALPGPAWRARFRRTRPAGVIPLPTDQTFASDRDLGALTDTQGAPGLSSPDTALGTEGTPAIAQPDSDAASAAESTPVIALSDTDAASAAEGVIGAGASIQVSGYDVGTVARPGLVWRRKFTHCTVQGALDFGTPASAATPISSSDTGSGADANAAPAVTAAETASAAEGAPSAALSGSDSAAAVEGTPSFAPSSADAAAAAEASATAISAADAASATDAESLTAQVPGLDSAAGTEGAPSVTLSSADTASAADAATVAAQVSGQDSATAAEAQAIALAGSDAGQAQDAAVLLPAGADTASAGESASVTVLVTGSDSGSADDEGTLQITRLGTDAGSLTDAQAVVLRQPDTASAAEAQLVSPIYPPATLTVDALAVVELVIALDVTGEDGSTVFLGLS